MTTLLMVILFSVTDPSQWTSWQDFRAGARTPWLWVRTAAMLPTNTYIGSATDTNRVASRAWVISHTSRVYDIIEAKGWDGADSICPLSETPFVAAGVLLALNGVAQRPDTDYVVSNDTVTFTFKPDSGDVSLALYQYSVGGTNGADTIEVASWLGTDSVINLANRPTGTAVLVTLNGVTQAPITDFVVDGDSVVMTFKPESADVSLVRYQGR